MGECQTYPMLLSLRPILICLAWLLSLSVHAGTLNAQVPNKEPIGKKISWLQEMQPMTLSDALESFRAGRFKPSSQSLLNFGIGAPPVWLALEVDNDTFNPLLRRLSIRTYWLDRIDIYYLQQDHVAREFHTGDVLPCWERPILDRYFDFDYRFPPGRTLVLIRVETEDPMVLPVFFVTQEQDYQSDLLEGYSYGFLYGGLSLLVAYNFLLFLSLKSRRYLYYSLYLSTFLLLNITYTGHGYRWLWPDAHLWEYWSHPVMLMVFPLTGVAFALSFLNIGTFFPQLQKAVTWFCVASVLLMAAIIAAGDIVLALFAAFAFGLLFAIGIVLLGLLALRAGEKSARYFLLATTSQAVTGIYSILTVMGVVPYSTLGFRAVDIGITIDAVLLAFALADQFRILQQQKLQALQLAMVDPLTGINNRRAFYKQVHPLWKNCIRNGHMVSLMMIDIDHFKRINDKYGHNCGDKVLKKLARTLVKEIRGSDIIARWGGEEFILFMPETTLSDAISFAERLRKTINNLSFTKGSKQLTVSASIGVACVDGLIIDLEGLIAAADEGLYLAKQAGRNQVCSPCGPQPVEVSLQQFSGDR